LDVHASYCIPSRVFLPLPLYLLWLILCVADALLAEYF
jgi:hypothetical protein